MKKKTPKLTDSELLKWIDILGVMKIELLYIQSKIILTPKQLDKVIELSNKPHEKTAIGQVYITNEQLATILSIYDENRKLRERKYYSKRKR